MGFAIAAGGGALLGGIISAGASQSAANTQAAAANNAANISNDQFNTTNSEEAPWRNAGASALGTIQSDLPSLDKPFSMSDFTADPGYQFSLQQAQQAIQNSGAAAGNLESGAQLKELANYTQGAAGQQYEQAYNNYNNNNNQTFNRLASIAGLGQTATNQTGQFGAQNAATVGSNLTSGANAQAAATVGGANAINSAIGGGMNSWMNTTMMNKMFPGSPAAAAGPTGAYGAMPGSAGQSYTDLSSLT